MSRIAFFPKEGQVEFDLRIQIIFFTTETTISNQGQK